MENVFNVNGLPFWSEKEIRVRNRLIEHFAAEMRTALLSTNPAWQFFQCEGPLLTPRHLLNANYTNEDIWAQEVMESETPLALRPETTPGSYAYAEHLMHYQQVKPPLVVWQVGKSFRREQDQVTKNMRLKEFYQMEFQCVFTADTMNDYHAHILEPMRRAVGEVIQFPTRLIESDRLPSYSEVTMDIEVDNGDKWMEVASISRRTDFPSKAKFPTKQGVVEKDVKVLEVALGMDRLVYNYMQAANR